MPDPMRRRPLARALPMIVSLALMAGLYVVSTMPAEPEVSATAQEGAGPISWALIHNMLHIPAYLVLALALFFCAYPGDGRPRRAAVFATGIAVAYGILLELAQAGVLGRYASLGDAVLNTIGATLGAMLAARMASPPVAEKASATDTAQG